MAWNWHIKHLEQRTFSKQLAAWVSNFVGSMAFVYLHVLWFGAWIFFGVESFPFSFLTMVVSLEAIFLSTFILISANDASERDRANAEEDYRTNLQAKEEIEWLQLTLEKLEVEKLDALLERMDSLDKAFGSAGEALLALVQQTAAPKKKRRH